jgi:predicted HTH transcriptional regulator
MNIKRMILDGEGVHLDFKKTITSCEKIAKTLVAYANAQGGRLFIGVADDGSIKGVKAEDEEKFMINKAAHQYCRPALEPLFEERYVDDKLILIVKIKESDLKPHYALADDGKWWVYIRVNDKSVQASKVVVDVLKKSHLTQGIMINYSENEQALLQYLAKNEKISLEEYYDLLNISRKKAYQILINLLLSGVIQVQTSEKGEYFYAI